MRRTRLCCRRWPDQNRPSLRAKRAEGGHRPTNPERFAPTLDCRVPRIKPGVLSMTIQGLPLPPLMLDIRRAATLADRSEEHTSELQSLMRNSYAVFCLKKKKKIEYILIHHHT